MPTWLIWTLIGLALYAGLILAVARWMHFALRDDDYSDEWSA